MDTGHHQDKRDTMQISEKGFLPLIAGIPTALIVLIIVIILLMIGPTIVFSISPTIKLIFQIFAAIVILNWVRNTVGPGTLSIVMSLVLIYIFVLMLPGLTGAFWGVYILLTFGLWSVIFWGLPIIFRK